MKIKTKPSKLIQAHLPCPSCSSSDALSLYDDGHTYCFSCGDLGRGGSGTGVRVSQASRHKTERNSGFDYDEAEDFSPTYSNSSTLGYNNKVKATSSSTTNSYIGTDFDLSSTPERNISYQFVPDRGLTKETMTFYGVKTEVSFEGKPLKRLYPYGSDASKERDLDRKLFRTQGQFKDAPLFGMDKFNPGQGVAITVTEGEEDAMSVFQMLGSKYPSVSVKTGAKGAKRDCETNWDYLNSFDKIYLCFDNDEPGQEATKEVAALFNPNKVFIVSLKSLKDANAYLAAGKEKDFTSTWWNAEAWKPKNVVSSFKEIKAILNKEGANTIAEYPFPDLNRMTYGIRSGEYVLVTAQEKMGKTEFFRAIEHHILKTTDFNIGVIHLEEKEKRAVQGLITYEVKRPVHLPDGGVSTEDQLAAYEALVKREDRVFFYTHFGTEDPDVILDVIRYLVQVNHCKFVFLDHITMLVTGAEDDDERRKLDYLSTKFAMMTKELDFTLFLISHVNDDGKTRGSRNISKICDLNVFISRDKENPDPELRSTVNVLVRDNRFSGHTGPAKQLKFDLETYTLGEKTYDAAMEADGVVDFHPNP